MTVALGNRSQSPVVLARAVRPSEKGFIAYVVENGVAKQRVVTLGMHTADGRVEVKSGLKVGERLVVRGAEALREDAKVRVEGEQAPEGSVTKPGRPGGKT